MVTDRFFAATDAAAEITIRMPATTVMACARNTRYSYM